MKSAAILSLAAVSAIGIASAAQAQPTLQITYHLSDPFLQANNLMSVTIRVVGFQDGQSIQGFHGPVSNPWNIGGPGTQFFNIDSVVDPDDPKSFLFEDGFYAAPAGNPALNALTGDTARWDSGLLGNPATLGSPADDDPDDTAGGFALFTDGSSDLNVVHATWISLQPNGVPVNSSTQWPLMRLTWPVGSPVTVSLLLLMNTPEGDIPLSYSVPSTLGGIGACCNAGDCAVMSFSGCAFSGGIYQGNFTDCFSVSCAPPPCPADLDGDGQVNVADLLDLIESWGAPGGPADLNADGMVNIADLLALITAWGDCA